MLLWDKVAYFTCLFVCWQLLIFLQAFNINCAAKVNGAALFHLAADPIDSQAERYFHVRTELWMPLVRVHHDSIGSRGVLCWVIQCYPLQMTWEVIWTLINFAWFPFHTFENQSIFPIPNNFKCKNYGFTSPSTRPKT